MVRAAVHGAVVPADGRGQERLWLGRRGGGDYEPAATYRASREYLLCGWLFGPWRAGDDARGRVDRRSGGGNRRTLRRSREPAVEALPRRKMAPPSARHAGAADRKSTRLNSSH